VLVPRSLHDHHVQQTWVRVARQVIIGEVSDNVRPLYSLLYFLLLRINLNDEMHLPQGLFCETACQSLRALSRPRARVVATGAFYQLPLLNASILGNVLLCAAKASSAWILRSVTSTTTPLEAFILVFELLSNLVRF
jgi:hypothetical protein